MAVEDDEPICHRRVFRGGGVDDKEIFGRKRPGEFVCSKTENEGQEVQPRYWGAAVSTLLKRSTRESLLPLQRPGGGRAQIVSPRTTRRERAEVHSRLCRSRYGKRWMNGDAVKKRSMSATPTPRLR